MADEMSLTRRQTLAVAGAAGLALTSSAHAQLSGQAATGIVFDDSDKSGRRNAASRGVSGVMVSNGRDVVQTDGDGRWTLPVQDGDSLFVIKPPGWMTPVDPATQLPLFAYVHEPAGTPPDLRLRFAGVPPTGKLPDSIDFPLRRQLEPGAFDVVLLTDPQPESLTELGYVRDDVASRAMGMEAAFGITHGDLMFDDLSNYDRYNRIIGAAGLPWHSCPGNHDMNLEAPGNRYSRETFKRVFGARHYAFQYGAATFFILDNVDYIGADPSRPNEYGKYQGRFGQAQLGFIRAVLAHVPRDTLVVYSFHIPLRTLFGAEPSVANTDTADFLDAISTHANSVSFSGHTHTNEHWYFGAAEGFSGGTHHHHVLTAASGSWWSGPFDGRGIPMALASDGAPNGFHILSVDGAGCSTRLVPAHDPERSQLRITLESQVHELDPEILRASPAGALLAGSIARESVAAARLVVNLFDGGPKSKVEFAVGGGRFSLMQRVARRDPFVEEVYARNEATKKPWVKASPSTHVWQAALPADLPRGAHRLSVRASDEFGRPHQAFSVLEVT